MTTNEKPPKPPLKTMCILWGFNSIRDGGDQIDPFFVFSYIFLKRIIPFPFWSIKGEAAKKINIHGCLGPKSYNYVGMFATTKREIDIFALYPIGGEIWFIIFGFAGYGN